MGWPQHDKTVPASWWWPEQATGYSGRSRAGVWIPTHFGLKNGIAEGRKASRASKHPLLSP